MPADTRAGEQIRWARGYIRRAYGGETPGLPWDEAEQVLTRAGFAEKQHPRDAHGRFARKPGGGAPATPPGGGLDMADPKAREFLTGIAHAEAALRTAATKRELEQAHREEIAKVLDEVRSTRQAVANELKAEKRAEEKHRAVRKFLVHVMSLIGVAALLILHSHMDTTGLIEAGAATGPLFVQEAIDWIKRL